MNRKIRLVLIIILPLTFWHINLKSQTQTEKERTIYLMRAKQFYGSGVKMDLMINGVLFNKIRSGQRLIVKTDSKDTLSFQIIYPLIKSNKSKVLHIAPDKGAEIYIDLFYWGEGYNPLKHAGALNPAGGTPEFNIEITELNLDEGRKKFNQSVLYKDNNKILVKKYLKE
jgi:hypothetical protein